MGEINRRLLQKRTIAEQQAARRRQAGKREARSPSARRQGRVSAWTVVCALQGGCSVVGARAIPIVPVIDVLDPAAPHTSVWKCVCRRDLWCGT